jgi:Flp pilus assembly protein TadD
LMPEQIELLLLRAILLGRLRRHGDAESDLRGILRLQASHGPAHFELGQLFWRKGLASEAATHFAKSLEYQPENGRVFYYLAEALNLMGDLPGANAVLDRALEATPRDGKVYHLRGRVLDRLGRPDEAREMYQRSRELQDP